VLRRDQNGRRRRCCEHGANRDWRSPCGSARSPQRPALRQPPGGAHHDEAQISLDVSGHTPTRDLWLWHVCCYAQAGARDMSQEVKSTCCYCGVGCGLLIEREGDKIVGVRGDPEDPANLGRLCTKGAALHLTARPDYRLLHPELRRQRGQARQRVGWDAALDHAADRAMIAGKVSTDARPASSRRVDRSTWTFADASVSQGRRGTAFAQHKQEQENHDQTSQIHLLLLRRRLRAADRNRERAHRRRARRPRASGQRSAACAPRAPRCT
jgi:hypothetical protein